MYILEDRTPSFRTSIAGTSWRTEEILDDMKKCGHGVQERLAVRHEQCTSQFVSSNIANTENLSSTSRPGLIENEDRLPGAVLLARPRLLERLRGVPLSANRGGGRPLSDRPELTLVDDQDLGTQASAGHLNLLERNRVEVKFECDFYYFGGDSHILRCGVHAECICPLVQHLSTDALPPTSIPAFPICSISNTVTPSPHLLNSCLELSHSNSTETTYNDFDSPLEGSHDDGCDSSLSLCTFPMGRNYLPPQAQVTSHISLPKLRLDLPGLGIGSNSSEGFHWGSSPTAHNFVSDDDFNWYSPSNSDDDFDFNLYSPSKKRRKS
ncbi:hypothetical protein CMV_012012 [Castanea mollissima]|uniref:Uncharacterized protein n=1 Tax=Castanea mollissima TaxID=60419 RepID=A0A8J4RG98_9ROSI|nr:hypothetical protein CMV_012012 [Castanea mollissima]